MSKTTSRDLEIIRRLLSDIHTETLYNAANHEAKDAYRSYHTAQAFSTTASILVYYGFTVEHGTWTDGGADLGAIERIGYLRIDDFEIVQNGKFNFLEASAFISNLESWSEDEESEEAAQ